MVWIHRSHPRSGDSEHFGNSFYNISCWLGQRQSKQLPRAAGLGERQPRSCFLLALEWWWQEYNPLTCLSAVPPTPLSLVNSCGNLKASFCLSHISFFLIHPPCKTSASFSQIFSSRKHPLLSTWAVPGVWGFPVPSQSCISFHK